MTDIVERLRDQGKDAFSRHYSLGMFGLCTEAADEIEKLRKQLDQANEWKQLAVDLAKAHEPYVPMFPSDAARRRTVSGSLLDRIYAKVAETGETGT